ncbi:MAG: prolipoprotein diacylglyceryl transferase [Elusimicrobia bacterium]|nr:MAG: prolipoprotein diacylglyceryl transferase [Elusimicrobiota bacterium]
MFPVLIEIGGFKFATYGLLVASGYLLAIWWLTTERERMGLDEDTFWSLIYTLFFGAIGGGKLLYFIIEWRSLLDGSLHLIRDIRFGFVFFGGLLGACLTGFWWVRKHKTDFMKIGDYFGVALPMGHAVGRLGCFAAGCCAGRPTTLPWGVHFSHPESLVPASLRSIPLHPTQLYESAMVAIAAFIALKTIRKVQAGKLPTGSAFAVYIGLYSLTRFANEFLRGDDRGGFFLGMSPSQWISLVVACWAIWIFQQRRSAAEAL